MFSLEFGPQIGFALGAETETTFIDVFGGETTTEVQIIDHKIIIKFVEFGLNFGVGVNFNKKLYAGLRYSLGLSDVNTGSDNLKMSNWVFSVSMGYKF